MVVLVVEEQSDKSPSVDSDESDDDSVAASDERYEKSLLVSSPVNAGTKRKQSEDFESSHADVKRAKVSGNYAIEFSQLLPKLYGLLEKLSVKILTFVLSQIQVDQPNKISLFSSKDLRGYNESTSAATVLKTLRHCWNWYDFSLLRKLMETCGVSEAVKLLDDFSSTVDFSQPLPTYTLPTISSSFEFCEESCFTVLATKIEKNYDSLTFESVKQVKLQITEKFEVSEHCLHLMAVNNNPTVLYWMIPKSIVSTISAKVHKQCGYLHSIDISEVAVYPNTIVATDDALKIGSLTYFSTSFIVCNVFILIVCMYNNAVLLVCCAG